MTPCFYCENGVLIKSYSDLISDINRNKNYHVVCKHNDFYSIFRDIIISMVSNGKITIIDNNLLPHEISALKISDDIDGKSFQVHFQDILNESDLLDRVILANKWELTIFTSGTTGTPKKITHNLKTITKAVKVSASNRCDIWGFAYNPTHIAGIQVFFQALLNLNQIVRLFMLTQTQIFESLEKYKVTHISSTPTFYRLLINLERQFPDVKRISLGGEKFDENLRTPLMLMFPNAKILNIYASTEIGTLFAAKGEIFSIKEHLKQFVKIVDNELLVSGEFIGKSEDIELLDGWFKTGDHIEIVSHKPLKIKFLGRVNESINVGGYKVYPTEVEELINTIPLVRKSVIYGKKNSVLGNIIMCDIEKEPGLLNESDIISYLTTFLQPYKIPRFINFVDKIEITRNGKIARR